MKQAFEVCKEIERCKKAISKSSSPQLTRQFRKHVQKEINELKQYCLFKGFNYKNVWERYKTNANSL